MRALIQRVSHASVTVDGRVTGRIGRGFVVLLGITHTDGRAEADWVAAKIAGLRVFDDDAGKMNRSLADVDGQLLVVSQFTLYGDARKGRRPSFTDAAAPELAEPLIDYFVETLRDAGFTVATGVFGAHMDVEIHNEGPITMLIER
ncbi:MAG: D-tyrosyl-tRNA(Tyr) deacylase [Anaerolineae bacterium]|nr:D-tyrosyl-tRNA(Tyr) deacylase [Anaerolineae bacterium]RIK15316.1 MAG: D-tyrosyl-tRNA(Tyr) deacylase [Anaerolineae bacterium]